ncbi:MFS transporter [Desulfitobacterium sp.]|uniref:MFS transporter n=1 Tax=Desulfitobacterium sp. TaxID=49981 RepID=UPI002B551AF3|nr:MFS transporter [Desulfitobacterium sp.]HVJ49665.1 MFS transporter [Desulfitobacterium sp.]
MSDNQKNGGFHYAYVIVIALCGIMGTAAALTFNAAGVFYGPVSKALGVGKGTFAIYMSIICLAAALTLTFAGKVYAKVNARTILTTAVTVIALSFFAMSRSTSVYHFYVIGAFMGACQAFLLYLAVPTMINRWFKTRTGFFLGLCSAFTGVGAVIFNPIAGSVITNSGWQTAYLIYAIVTAVVGIPCALLISSYPSDKGLKPFGDTGEAGTVTAAAPVTGISYSVALKSSYFYIALLFAFAIAFVTNINAYLPSYATSLGMTLTIGATVASASMFGNMFGKIILGIIIDKINVMAGLVVGIAGGIIGMGMMIFMGKAGVWVIMVGGFLYGVSYACNNVVVPMTIRKAFGSRDYSQIFGNVSIAAALSSTIGSSAWGFVIDGTGSYALTLAVACGILVLAFVLGYAVMSMTKKVPHTAE